MTFGLGPFGGSMFMAAAAAQQAQLEFGTMAMLGNGTVIKPSQLGAEIGDLLMISSPHGLVAPSGSGWTNTDYIWWQGLNYQARFTWKPLDSLDDISVSGQNFGAVMALARGPTSAAIVYSADAQGDEASVAFPDKDPDAIGLMVFGQSQTNTMNLNPTTGWGQGFHGNNSVFTFDVLTNANPPTGAHTPVFSGGGGQVRRMIGVELRI
jgi:hypothetical protein